MSNTGLVLGLSVNPIIVKVTDGSVLGSCVFLKTDVRADSFRRVRFFIVVRFEEINSKFKKVRKSLRSTFSHNCYRKTLSMLNIVTVLG